MKRICRNCTFWETFDGDTPYCLLKDLYTETAPDHQCDEGDMFNPTHDEEE